MPHVSGKKIKRGVFKKISKEFIKTLASPQSKSETALVLKELLTQTEKIMLAKRMALILMIQRGYSFETIKKSLKVTQQTVSRYYRGTKNNRFSALKRSISKEKERKAFWHTLETELRLGMPPMGKNRWDFLDKN